MARMLMDRGFVRVRPLAGGLDGWVASGYGVEEIELMEAAAEAAGS